MLMLQIDDVSTQSVKDKQSNYKKVNATKDVNCLTVLLITICKNYHIKNE